MVIEIVGEVGFVHGVEVQNEFTHFHFLEDEESSILCIQSNSDRVKDLFKDFILVKELREWNHLDFPTNIRDLVEEEI
jgi:hypothetical protein